jgi:hypothetical protein
MRRLRVTGSALLALIGATGGVTVVSVGGAPTVLRG